MRPVLRTQILVSYLALEKGFVTEEHLRACVQEVKSNGGNISLDKLLVSKGFISDSQRKVLNLATQHFLKQKEIPHFGEIALGRALITRQELEDALEFQQKDHVRRRLGEILLMKGLITFEEHFEILNSQFAAAQKTIQSNIFDRIPKELVEALQSYGPQAGSSADTSMPFSPTEIMTPPDQMPDMAAPAPAPPQAPVTAPPSAEAQAVQESDDGTKILGDYRILRELGRGAMGVVYLAIQRSLKRKVALKVLPTSLTVSERMISRFYREAELAAKLQHPGIVQIYGMGEESGNHYFAMEYIEGVPLDEKLKQEFVEYGVIADFIAQSAEALDYAHQAGIIHRDIKPSNLLITSDKVKVGDFGLARPKEATTLTAAGTIVGTPMYMSPEQAQGHKKNVDYHTDIYSLGATMYFALTKRNPFQSEDVQAILRMVVESEPVEPRKVNPMIPRDLEVICQKAMSKDPRRRYESAIEFAQDIRRFIAGEPIKARSQTKSEKLARWLKRNLLKAAIIILGASLVIFGWLGYGLYKERKEATRQADEKKRLLELAAQNLKLSEEEREKQEERHKQERDEAVEAAIKAYEERLKLDNAASTTTPDRQRPKGPPVPKGEVAKLIDRAKDSIKKKEYTAALRFLDDAVRQGSQYFEPIYLRGTVYNKLEDWSNAKADFDSAIKLNPNFYGVFLQRGIARQQSRDLTGATQDFIIAIELNPRSWSAYEHSGDVYFEKSAYQQAIKQWEKALEINPKLKYLKRRISEASRFLGKKN